MKADALIIGRFQPFHYGHLHAVKYVLEREEKIYIGVGSALEAYTKRNPFTFAERFKMIFDTLIEEGISQDIFYIFPIPDAEIHSTWVDIVFSIVPPVKRVYSNDPLTQVLMSERGIEVNPIPLVNRDVYSGEEFRRRVVEGEDWSDLVPGTVKRIIIDLNLDERIRRLWMVDKPKRIKGGTST